MANYDLVVKPLLIALVLFIGALLYFLWLRKASKRPNILAGSKRHASLFGYGLFVLGGFSLFISLFFLISG